MHYNPQYFIDKFSVISDDQWCTEFYECEGKRCALGHCGETANSLTEESIALEYLLEDVGCGSPSSINDGKDLEFQQMTPKARILAALQQAKKN